MLPRIEMQSAAGIDARSGLKTAHAARFQNNKGFRPCSRHRNKRKKD
jgi:hypothetical protein